MNERFPPYAATRKPSQSGSRHIPDSEAHFGEAERASRIRRFVWYLKIVFAVFYFEIV